jgi:predicted nucleic acid-binding protein
VPFLIDSNVLIDVSRGNVAAIKYVDTLPEPWSISQVTAMELIVGARGKRELDDRQFLGSVPGGPA